MPRFIDYIASVTAGSFRKIAILAAPKKSRRDAGAPGQSPDKLCVGLNLFFRLWRLSRAATNENVRVTGMSEEKSRDGLGPISRREFTIGSVAVLGASSAAGQGAKTIVPVPPRPGTQAAAPQKVVVRPVSPAAKTIKLTVNNWNYEVPVEPEWPLRDVLREQLGLLSIKDMCNGYGACGSCTVLMNGRPILSCMTLAIECDGAKIETAEGIAAANPRLIEAYVLNHCMQCGYCTPGFVVSAKALLDRKPHPDGQDIREALGGNICRCGTYPQHIIAVLEAAGAA
jgi:aerobic-type carbon monoxide dehydrogenase small subunit (CoxS/CutS family)